MLKIIANAISFISGIANSLGSIFGFLKQRDAEKNSPEMIKNKEAQQEQNLKDKVSNDLKTGNLSEIEKDIAD